MIPSLLQTPPHPPRLGRFMAGQHCQGGWATERKYGGPHPAFSAVRHLCTLVRRHLGHTSILAALALLQTLVVERLLLLLLGHVSTMWRRTGHARLRRRHCRDIFWRVRDIAAVNAIFGASRLGRIQTGLDAPSQQMTEHTRAAKCHTWMRFLPSGLVTRGWSLGVVNV